MRRYRYLMVLSAAFALALAPTVAHAAPAYVTSDPENHEEMDQAPAEVRVVFDNPLDPSSLLLVTDECNREIDDGNILIAANTISVGIDQTPKGTYTVRWKVRAPGGVGGDASGQIIFHVTEGKFCGPASERTGSGGHGGHGNHGGGGDGGGGHGNHGGGGDGGGGHGNHGSNTGGHSGHDPSGTDHSAHAASNDQAHEQGAGEHGNHGDGKDKDDGAPETPGVAAPQPPVLAGDDSGAATVTGDAVLMALMTSLLLGAAGGWLIRNLTPA